MGFRHNSAFRHTTSSATSIKLQELIAVVSFIQHPSGLTNKKQESRSLKAYISTLMSLSFDIQISSRNNRDVIVFAFILSLVGRTRDGQLAGSGFT